MGHGDSNGSGLYLWFICITASLGGLLFGYDVVVVSGIISQVVKQFEMTAFELGVLVSCVLWGCALGSIIGGVLIDNWGRKKVMLTSAVIMLASAIWSGLAGSPQQLVMARLIGGIGCGFATTVCPLFISEVSPERERGRMVTLYHFSVCFGIVLCVFVDWTILSFAQAQTTQEGLSAVQQWLMVDEYWRAMLISEAIPGILFLAPLFFLPESPRWLVKTNRMAEGKTILARLLGAREAKRVSAEIEETLEAEKDMTFSDLFAEELRKPLFLAILICVLSEACGISAVLYYGPQLFEQAGLSLGNALGGFTILSIVNLLFNFVAIALMDKVGRKLMLALGSTGAMLSLMGIGILYLTHQTGILVILLTVIFIAFFAFSIGPVKFVILSEIFPNRIRGKAISVGTLCIWLTSAAVAQLFPMLREVMHTGIIFLIFAADVGALLLVSIFLLPETKGRSIEEIERGWLKPYSYQ